MASVSAGPGAGVVGGRATGFAFGLLKLSPPRTAGEKNLTSNEAWQDGDRAGVTALAFCAAANAHLPHKHANCRTEMHSRTHRPRVFVIFDSTYTAARCAQPAGSLACRWQQLMQSR